MSDVPVSFRATRLFIFLLCINLVWLQGFAINHFVQKASNFTQNATALKKQSTLYSSSSVTFTSLPVYIERTHYYNGSWHDIVTRSRSYLKKCCCFVSRFLCSVFSSRLHNNHLADLTWLVSWGWSWLSFFLWSTKKTIHSEQRTTSIINIDLSNPYCAKQYKKDVMKLKSQQKKTCCVLTNFFGIRIACASFLKWNFLLCKANYLSVHKFSFKEYGTRFLKKAKVFL